MPAKSEKPVHDPAIWDELRAMTAGREEVLPGKCFGYPALYYVDPDARPAQGKRVKRKLFATAYGRGAALKLPQELIEDLLSEPGFEPFTPYHMPPMKGWVLYVPDTPAILREQEELLETALALAAGG